jgi:hypothetical protein
LSYLQQRDVRYLIIHSQPDPRRYVEVANPLGLRHEVQLLKVDRTTTEEVALCLVASAPLRGRARATR